MQVPRSAAICAILVVASACVALVTVSAQISDIQPFTAIQTQITRFVELPIPNVSTQILAVSGDGQLIATLSRSDLPGRPLYHRTVWNKREKTKVGIDPEFKMLVVYQYHQPKAINCSAFSEDCLPVAVFLVPSCAPHVSSPREPRNGVAC
jgi:hypothetical protein